MVKNLVIKKISKLLSKHFKGVNENTLELALLSGMCTLNNLELRTENIQKYFNYKINAISIGSITLKYSILSLFYKPIEVYVNDLKVSIDKNIEFNKGDFIFEKLKFLELETENIGGSNTLGGLAMQFFEKAIIKIRNIDICFNASDQEDIERGFNLRIDNVNTTSTDENWHENIGIENLNTYFKIFEIQKLRINYNSIDIVEPCDLKCRIVVRKRNFNQDLPDLNVDFIIPNICGSFDLNCYETIINSINTYNFQRTMKKTIKNNLNLFDIYTRKELGTMKKFRKIMEILAVNPKVMDPEDIKESKSKRYCELYQKFTTGKIDEEEIKHLNDFEEKEDVYLTLKLRKQVLNEKKLQPKRRFFFWTQTVTEEEKKELCEDLQIEETKEKVSSFQVSFMIQQLDITVCTDIYKTKFIIDALLLKHNSINGRTNCVLKYLGVFHNNDFLLESIKSENFALFHHEDNKLLLSFNHLNLKKLYVLKMQFQQFIDYKLMEFNEKLFDVRENLLKTKMKFAIETNDVRYFLDSDHKGLIFKPCEISGDFKEVGISLGDISLFNTQEEKTENIIENMKFKFSLRFDKENFDIEGFTQEININEITIIRNFQPLMDELLNFRSISGDNTTLANDKVSININVANIIMSDERTNLKDIKLERKNNINILRVDRIRYNGIKLLNLYVELHDKILFKNVEIMINLNDFDSAKTRKDYNLVKNHVLPVFKHSQDDMADVKIDILNFHQVSILIMDDINIYNISIEKIIGLNIFKTLLLANKTKISIDEISLNEKNILMDGILITRYPCSLGTVEDLFRHAVRLGLLPLEDRENSIDVVLNLNNISIIDNNISNCPVFNIESKNFCLHIFQVFRCWGEIQMSTTDNKNSLQIAIDFTRDKYGKGGSSKVSGLINTEFAITTIYTLMGVIDLILMIMGHLFQPNNDISMLKWQSEFDLQIINFTNEEFLIRLKGIIDVLCESGFLYNLENFDINKEIYNYHNNRKIHLMTHENIYNLAQITKVTYNLISIQSSNVFGFDEQNHIALFLDEFKIDILKNCYSMDIAFIMSELFIHTKIYKILLLRQYFLPPDINFEVPSINSEILINGKIEKIIYKNIGIRNIVITNSLFKFEVDSFIENSIFYDEYRNVIYNCDPIQKFVIPLHEAKHNAIQTPAIVSIQLSNIISHSQYDTEIKDLYIYNGNIYNEYVQYFMLTMSDMEIFNQLYPCRNRISIFSVECRRIKILYYNQFLLCFEYMHILNTVEKPSVYDGCIIGQIDTINNQFIEKYYYAFEYCDKVFNIKGNENLRAKFTKLLIYEKDEKKMKFNNLSNLACSVYCNNKEIKSGESTSVKQFYDSQFTVMFDNIKISCCIKTHTYEFKHKGGIYFIDVSIRNDTILVRVYNNIVFKNYTNYNFDIFLGNDSVTRSEHKGKVRLEPFGDKSYSDVSDECLFFRLFVDDWNDSPDVVQCSDGKHSNNTETPRLKLDGRKGFFYSTQDTFMFICADIVVAENNGFRIFYVFIYVPYFINNCTGIDISFILRNKTCKFSKEITIQSSMKNESTTTNICILPYANISDNIDLIFHNGVNKSNILNICTNNHTESMLVLNDGIQYGVMYEQKERIIHGLSFYTNIHEIIIHPYYIVNNNLETMIYLGDNKIHQGQNILDFANNKKVKLLFNSNFKTRNEINIGSIEFFTVLKLERSNIDTSFYKYFSEKAIFKKLIPRKTTESTQYKNLCRKYYQIENIESHKNIAVEMNYGTGKYSNTHIVNIKYANILKNSTEYTFLISVDKEIHILKPGESSDIHFGESDDFYIFFLDEFGFEEVTKFSDEEDIYKYFLFKQKIYRLLQKTTKYLKEAGSYVAIRGLSPKYFYLKRTHNVLFKLLAFIDVKQRYMEIITVTKWPIKIINNTNEVVSISQVRSQRIYYIKQNQGLDYCYDFLYKEKSIEINHKESQIIFSSKDEEKVKHGLLISSYSHDEIWVIEISYVFKKRPDIIHTQFEFNLHIPFFSLSICDKTELICVHLKNLDFRIKKVTIRGEERFIYDITGSSIQIDDQSFKPNFPVILNAKLNEFNMLYNQKNVLNKFFRVYLEITPNKASNQSLSDINPLEYFNWRIICFSFSIQEFYLRVDEDVLITMLSFLKLNHKHKFILQCNDCEKYACLCFLKKKPPCKYIKIESFLINPIVSSLSFKKGKTGKGILKKIITLLASNISDYKVKLDAEFLTNIDNPIFSIQEVVSNHYKTQVYKDIFKVLLSVDFFGNIGSFADTFSMGIKDLFYEPFLGLKDEDPKKFSMGLLRGGKSLVKHTVSGISGILAKISDGFSKNIGMVTFDKDFQNYQKNLYSGYIDDVTLHVHDPEIRKNDSLKPIAKGYDRFVDSISSGVTGMVDKPFEGAKKGLGGFVKGVGKGAIGLITKPTVGLFDMIGGMADGIKTGLDGGKLCRLQYPRYSVNDAYNFEQNMAYYVYLRYLTDSAPSFIYGEVRNEQHLILSNGIVFVFTKKTSLEIPIYDIHIIRDTSFVYDSREILTSARFIEKLKMFFVKRDIG